MWPFKSSRFKKQAAARGSLPGAGFEQHIAEALAPLVRASAKENAIAALMALPQNSQILECYGQIAVDTKQAWQVRRKAMDGMELSRNVDGARALLRCVATDLRRMALSALGGKGMPEAIRKIGPEAQVVLVDALRQISSEAEGTLNESLLWDLDLLQELLRLIDTSEAKALLLQVQVAIPLLRNRLVPSFLKCALTSNDYRSVKQALTDLDRLNTTESKAALAKFRSVKSRLVEKIIVPGVGCSDTHHSSRHVYTSEFGQPKCDAEIAVRAEEERKWEKSQPKPTPPPAPEPATPVEPSTENAWPVECSQYYAAASARGIEKELLALVDNQLDFLKSLHLHESLSPVAAGMDLDGKIDGFSLITQDAEAADKGVEEGIAFFTEKLQAGARAKRLLASAIFYHGCHGPGRGAFTIAPAQTIGSADCIVALLDHLGGQAVTCVFQYTRGSGPTDGGWNYAPAYYAPKQPNIFVDPVGCPLAPNRARTARFVRRPASTSDQGTHPELMTLVENQLKGLEQLRRSGSLAPVVATMNPAGDIQTMLVANQEVGSDRHFKADSRNLVVVYPQGEGEKTAAGAIMSFVEKLRAAASAGEIVASAIFFHAIYNPETVRAGLNPAEFGEVPDCIVVQLDHRMSQSISLVIRYSMNPANGEYHYAPAEHYSAFPIIFTELVEEPETVLGGENAPDLESIRIAAEQGDVFEQAKLGYFYLLGNGVEQDDTEAVKWFSLAAEQGQSDGQYALGYLYHEGRGVTQNFAESVKWYREAAGQGHAIAQMNLGACYHSGEGVAKDDIESYAWFSLASGAQEDAALRRDFVEQKLSPEQLSKGQRRTAELREQIEARHGRDDIQPISPAPFVGGLYYTEDDDGFYSVLKVLKLDPGIVHVRLYSNQFISPISKLDESTLYLAGMDHGPNERIGIGHAPISVEGFQTWNATFIRQSTVTDEELEAYRLWKEG